MALAATALVVAPPAIASNYSWTYDQRGGSGGTNVASFTVCRAYSLTSTSRSGFTFLGWYTATTGGTRVGGAGGSYTNCSSITLYAQWNYAVTFDGNDGTAEVGSISNTGVGVTLPSATRSGYTFSGWFSATTGGVRRGGAGNIYDPNANITVFAQWVPATYEITYEANGGTVAPTSTNFTTGDPALTLPTPTRAQHTFNGWYTSPAGGELIGAAGASYTPAATATLHAQWTFVPSPSPPDPDPAPGGGGDSFLVASPQPETVTISMNTSGGSSCRQTSESGIAGAWINLPGADFCTAPASRAGAKLLGWATNPDFPVQIAQRQVTNGWGAYEIFNDEGRITSVFIPAGGAAFLSTEGDLFAIWSE